MTKEQIKAIRARSGEISTASTYNLTKRRLVAIIDQAYICDIPALLAEVERLQATLEQTWEWDMYQCAQREIYRLRSAQPVRCGECKMYSNNIPDDNLRNGFCTRLKNYYFDNKEPTDYCSYGQRKESE